MDMGVWFNFIIFDIIGDLLFGVLFGCLESSLYYFWVMVIFKGVKEFVMLLVMNWFFFSFFRVVKVLIFWYYLVKYINEQVEFVCVQVVK